MHSENQHDAKAEQGKTSSKCGACGAKVGERCRTRSDDQCDAGKHVAPAASNVEAGSQSNLIAPLPAPEGCSPAYGDCRCSCHRMAGVKHIMPCCYPEHPSAPIGARYPQVVGMDHAQVEKALSERDAGTAPIEAGELWTHLNKLTDKFHWSLEEFEAVKDYGQLCRDTAPSSVTSAPALTQDEIYDTLKAIQTSMSQPFGYFYPRGWNVIVDKLTAMHRTATKPAITASIGDDGDIADFDLPSKPVPTYINDSTGASWDYFTEDNLEAYARESIRAYIDARQSVAAPEAAATTPEAAPGVAAPAARDAALQEAADVCAAIYQNHRDQYKGRGKWATQDNPRRADTHADGCSDGASECEEAVLALKGVQGKASDAEDAARNAALAECVKIAEAELRNTCVLTSSPLQSSAAWKIVQNIKALMPPTGFVMFLHSDGTSSGPTPLTPTYSTIKETMAVAEAAEQTITLASMERKASDAEDAAMQYQARIRLFAIGKQLEDEEMDEQQLVRTGAEIIALSGVCQSCHGEGTDGEAPDAAGEGGWVGQCSACGGSGIIAARAQQQDGDANG